jgi:hypothetical protein
MNVCNIKALFNKQTQHLLGMFLQNCVKQLLALLCLSVHLFVLNSLAPTWQIFMKFDIWVFLKNILRKFKFH